MARPPTNGYRVGLGCSDVAALMIPIVIFSSIWVIIDASNHGIRKDHKVTWYQGGPIGWGLGSLLLWILVFPTYVASRSKLIDAARTQPLGYSMPVHLPPPTAPPSTAPPPPPPASVADELVKLDGLRASGVLTDDEFAVQKARLLEG